MSQPPSRTKATLPPRPVGLRIPLSAAHVARSAPPSCARLFDPDAARGRLTAADNELRRIETDLWDKYPAAAEFGSPKALRLEDIQKLLRPDETLIKILVDHQASYVWAVTDRDAAWIRVAAGISAMEEHVDRLRCGLDREGEWTWSEAEQTWRARRVRCSALQVSPSGVSGPLPFPAGTAHELYQLLFGRLGRFLEHKHLLVVPLGPLTCLPLQVLLTTPAGEAVVSQPELVPCWIGWFDGSR